MLGGVELAGLSFFSIWALGSLALSRLSTGFQASVGKLGVADFHLARSAALLGGYVRNLDAVRSVEQRRHFHLAIARCRVVLNGIVRRIAQGVAWVSDYAHRSQANCAHSSICTKFEEPLVIVIRTHLFIATRKIAD